MQRTGSTLKEGKPIEKRRRDYWRHYIRRLTRHKWFVSLKDINGITFSAYPASSIFNARCVT